jgi:hypothetical protein
VAAYFSKNPRPLNHSIEDNVKYALRKDGPAMFATPEPLDNPESNEPGYVVCAPLYSLTVHCIRSQEPDGIFQSPFVITLATNYLKFMKDHALKFGRPVSLVALAAASVKPFISFFFMS